MYIFNRNIVNVELYHYVIFKVNVGGFGVKTMMDTWTRQMGFPYINITMATTGTKTIVVATQRRFLADKATEFDPTESPFRYIVKVALGIQDKYEYFSIGLLFSQRCSLLTATVCAFKFKARYDNLFAKLRWPGTLYQCTNWFVCGRQ